MTHIELKVTHIDPTHLSPYLHPPEQVLAIRVVGGGGRWVVVVDGGYTTTLSDVALMQKMTSLINVKVI